MSNRKLPQGLGGSVRHIHLGLHTFLFHSRFHPRPPVKPKSASLMSRGAQNHLSRRVGIARSSRCRMWKPLECVVNVKYPCRQTARLKIAKLCGAMNSFSILCSISILCISCFSLDFVVTPAFLRRFRPYCASLFLVSSFMWVLCYLTSLRGCFHRQKSTCYISICCRFRALSHFMKPPVPHVSYVMFRKFEMIFSAKSKVFSVQIPSHHPIALFVFYL